MSEVTGGDIVLVSFPFTDLSTSKLRPAVVISREGVHCKEDDYTLLFISSVIPEVVQSHEVLFTRNHPDFGTSGLKKDSLFKANKIATVQKALLKRRLGTLGLTIRSEIQLAFRSAIIFS